MRAQASTRVRARACAHANVRSSHAHFLSPAPARVQINSWEEVDKLSNNSVLENLLLVGNPLHAQYEDASTPSSEYRLQVLKRLPTLIKLDGVPIDPDERAAVKAL